MIITSPLKRAVETGKIVAAKMNVPLYREVLLIEQNYGIYEGVDRKEPQFLITKEISHTDIPAGSL
ncbi:histidine phosphatase family protein [[Clostridium] scindens]|uniref:histidine phosphatase family protein n=1 Tax=Clostridium scindens (strain JCM 10418 / VPI 12708) TaxID=29347 RepID=UPI003AF12D69